MEFELNSNPVDAAGADKMFGIYNDLYRRVKTTPSLYRSRRPFPGGRTNIIKVPIAKRYVIFGLGDDESEVTSIAEQELEPKGAKANDVVLNFSSEAECGKR